MTGGGIYSGGGFDARPAPDRAVAPESREARSLVMARVGTIGLIDDTALSMGGRAGSS